ncbi:hypothetical protein ACOBQX_07920 [Actinokineospora sp. G85]|uniref:hypothetical protein n=1 Tax=Actinokineospora sp. G85 TaxID=3406626 RepID=UPI003C75E4FE
MNTDPRLRLLGTSDASSGMALLNALDETRVIIRTGPDMVGAHTTSLAAFVGLTARLFGDVVVEQPVDLAANWWGVSSTDALLDALHAVRPRPATAPRRGLVVTFGDRVANGDLGVGGDDYTVRLGPEPQPLGAGPVHALGVHAAVCLAVSQLLLAVLEPYGFPGSRCRALRDQPGRLRPHRGA